jgi:hypothetical protein
VQRKLTYHHHLSTDLLNIEIHNTLLIIEYAQAAEFAHKPIYILSGVGLLDAYQNEKTFADARKLLLVDSDTRSANSLNK